MDGQLGTSTRRSQPLLVLTLPRWPRAILVISKGVECDWSIRGRVLEFNAAHFSRKVRARNGAPGKYLSAFPSLLADTDPSTAGALHFVKRSLRSG